MTSLSENDNNACRALLSEFVSVPDRTGMRMELLVGRYWELDGTHRRRELAQVLVILLDPKSVPGRKVPEDVERECCDALARWLSRRPHQPTQRPYRPPGGQGR